MLYPIVFQLDATNRYISNCVLSHSLNDTFEIEWKITLLLLFSICDVRILQLLINRNLQNNVLYSDPE